MSLEVNGRLIETPELDRQLAVVKSGEAETVQRFYDWLTEKEIHLAYYDSESKYGRMLPHDLDGMPEQLLADFFGIDRDKVETERRLILEALRDESEVP